MARIPFNLARIKSPHRQHTRALTHVRYRRNNNDQLLQLTLKLLSDLAEARDRLNVAAVAIQFFGIVQVG